jgi:hypothetical protein
MPRPRSALAFLAAILLFLAAPANATHPRGSSRGSYHSHSTAHHYRSHSGHTRRYAYGVPRDSHGRIKRSSEEKKKFERESGYPHGRPGYVVDHIIPLSQGGRDDPSNMQWQTKEEAKAKDRTERGSH